MIIMIMVVMMIMMVYSYDDWATTLHPGTAKHVISTKWCMNRMMIIMIVVMMIMIMIMIMTEYKTVLQTGCNSPSRELQTMLCPPKIYCRIHWWGVSCESKNIPIHFVFHFRLVKRHIIDGKEAEANALLTSHVQYPCFLIEWIFRRIEYSANKPFFAEIRPQYSIKIL